MPKKNETYESMVTSLEKIVEAMEEGSLPLEEAIKSYEDGIKLCNKLYKVLNEAEGKIKVLNGNSEVDFDNKGE